MSRIDMQQATLWRMWTEMSVSTCVAVHERVCVLIKCVPMKRMPHKN